MLKNVKEYLYPESLDEALDLLKKKGKSAKVVGGGLDIVWRSPKGVEYLIDLENLGLSYIEEDEEKIKIGAKTTIGEAQKSLVVGKLFKGKLTEVFSEIATPIIRNVITFGGSVARNYPWSDITAILLTIDASLVIFTGEEKEMTLSEFMRVEIEEFLDEAIIKEVRIKKFDPSYHFSYIRFTRTASDIPLLNEGMLLKFDKEQRVEDAIVVIGARPFGPTRMETVEEFLLGKTLTDEVIGKAKELVMETVKVADDMRISGDYRRELSGVLTKRNLMRIREEI